MFSGRFSPHAVKIGNFELLIGRLLKFSTIFRYSFATFRGRRLKLRYRGVTRNHAWLKRRTAALNLRNLAGKGLTRRDGAWVLAT